MFLTPTTKQVGIRFPHKIAFIWLFLWPDGVKKYPTGRKCVMGRGQMNKIVNTVNKWFILSSSLQWAILGRVKYIKYIQNNIYEHDKTQAGCVNGPAAVGGVNNFMFYLENIFWISSILFPLVSGTKINVKTPPTKQIPP